MPDSDLRTSEEIRAMSEAARSHLSHLIRNGMQGVAGAIEMKRSVTAIDEINEMSEKLRRLGL